MPKVIEGTLQAEGMKFAVAASRFNDFITRRLVDGALDALKRHGANLDEVEIVWTPGAFELPLVVRRLAASGKYDAVLAIGAVIRGGTPHFDYVAAESAKGIAMASLETGVPCIYGVLTADTIEQAIERAGTKMPNRGFEAGLAAVEMVSLLRQLA